LSTAFASFAQIWSRFRENNNKMLFCLTLLLHLGPPSCHAAAQRIDLKGAQVEIFDPFLFTSINPIWKMYYGRYSRFCVFCACWVYIKKRSSHAECALKKDLRTLSVFDLSLKKKFLPQHAQHVLTQKIRGKKLRTHDENEIISNFLFTVPKSPTQYPWRLYGIKITRIHEIKNLTLGHL
jgi:hypothetical protein